MGSLSSKSNANKTINELPSPTSTTTTAPDVPDLDKYNYKDDKRRKTSKESELSGMPLVHYKCRKKKRRYDKCVSDWYQKDFMTGKSMDQDSACGEVFEAYKTCVLKGIKKEIWDKQGLPPPKEGSALAELGDDD